MDNDYDYLGNQLTRVEDATGDAQGFKDVNSAVGTQEYCYDRNGNMKTDTNKGINDIQYNYLNLPQTVAMYNGDTIRYAYDAAGIKHQKMVNDGSPETTTYVGGFHYNNDDLKFLQHAEGRVLKDGSTWNYEYNLTDHLGNVRVTVNESGNVVQRDGYYSFGLTFNSSATSPENLYKYNGFEEQKETGWYDYLARQYDPELGRFTSIDPAADLMRRQGPYNYAFNNPIRFIDPDGMMPEDKVEDSPEGGSYEADLTYKLIDDEKNIHEIQLNQKWSMTYYNDEGVLTEETITRTTTATTTVGKDGSTDVSVNDKVVNNVNEIYQKEDGNFDSRSVSSTTSEGTYSSMKDFQENAPALGNSPIAEDLGSYQGGLEASLSLNSDFNPYNGIWTPYGNDGKGLLTATVVDEVGTYASKSHPVANVAVKGWKWGLRIGNGYRNFNDHTGRSHQIAKTKNGKHTH